MRKITEQNESKNEEKKTALKKYIYIHTMLTNIFFNICLYNSIQKGKQYQWNGVIKICVPVTKICRENVIVE